MAAPFKKNVVIALGALTAISFLAGLIYAMLGPGVQSVSSSRADTFSRSAIGHQALLRLLKRMPVRLGADVHGRDVFSAPAEPEHAAPSETAAPAPVEADPAQPFDPEDES